MILGTEAPNFFGVTIQTVGGAIAKTDCFCGWAIDYARLILVAVQNRDFNKREDTNMALKPIVPEYKAVQTAWGKLINQKEAYNFGVRHIAAFSANLFQLMRIIEPDWEKRTAAISETAYGFNKSASAADQTYVEAYYDEWNIPEFCERSAWLGAIWGDSGDEYENMAGRVIQFTRDRVEKELDTCPWDIVGSEMCNMTTGMFTANFDLTSVDQKNEVRLNMCEARGCGNRHCRVVAERRDVTGLPQQGWLDHRGQASFPVHNTPEERTVKEGQILRNGKYTNAFGEEKSFDWAYNWVMTMGWVWSIQFPLVAMGDMCDDDEEMERLMKIAFSIAGKNQFIEPSAYEGLRDFLGVPRDIDKVDSRIMGSYVKTLLDCQLVPCEFTAFEKEETRIHCDCDDFVGRYEMAPLDELVVGYEAQWNNAVKTLSSPEFSVWFEGVDTEDMEIVIGKKIDNRMI